MIRRQGNDQSLLKVCSPLPYLSMVISSRNDDYAGGMLGRLQFSINVLIRQMERHQIDSELILIDYNPPLNRKPLKDSLLLPTKSAHLSVRIIEVPPELHAKYCFSRNTPINAAVASNVGLSRARGQFSVVRVSDIIWSEELISYIKKKDLDGKTKYRCTRRDITKEVLNHPDWTLKQTMEFCSTHFTSELKKMKYYIRGLPTLLLNSDGDFQLMSTENFRRLRGYQESRTGHSSNVDGLLEFCAYAAGIKDKLLEEIYVYKITHSDSYKNRILASFIPFYDRISKSIPANLLGPVFIKMTRMTGLSRLFYDSRRISVRGIPQPTRKEYYDLCREIVSGKRDYVLNEENWGLSEESLKEYKVLEARWEM